LVDARKKGRGSSPVVREGSAEETADVSEAVNQQVAILRLEQFHPFPGELLSKLVASYPQATELVWAQEEPRNMGGWTFVEPRLENLLPQFGRPRYVGRTASASPATGSYHIHQLEQAKLTEVALTISASGAV